MRCKKIKTTTTSKTKTTRTKRTNKETRKIKQQIRHDSTLEVNNTHFKDK